MTDNAQVPSAPDVIEEVNRLISALQAHEDAQVREQLAALLEGIDAIHRVALTHLIDGIRGMAGDAFVNKLVADPAVRLLLMSYDLLAVNRRLLAEEALDAVRGHLHAHGIDVELTEVHGGAVYVKLHGMDKTQLPLDAVRRDLEAALAAGLIGFQQLDLEDRAKPQTGLVQLRGARKPVYKRVAALADVPPDTLRSVEADGIAILLANVDGDIYALANHCGDSPLPLEFSTVEGSTIRCSWHSCLYDARSGRRVDGMGDSIPVYPVAVNDEGIHVAVSTA